MADVDHSQFSNSDIAKALREGTDEGFAVFYEAFAPRLARFVARSLSDEAIASDIVHDAMIVVRSNIGQLRDDEHLTAWVYTITRNRLRAHARKNARTVLTSDIPDVVVEPDFSRVVETRQLASLVSAAVAGLTAKEKLVYDLYVVSAMPIERLAVTLDLSVGNTRKLVQRVRLRMARSMEALLLAQSSSIDCPEFQMILSGWDGQLSPLWRKRIAHHVDVCAGCEQQCGGIIAMTSDFGLKKVSVEPRSRTLSV